MTVLESWGAEHQGQSPRTAVVWSIQSKYTFKNIKGGIGATLQLVSQSTMTSAGPARAQARLDPRSGIGVTNAETMLLSRRCRLSNTSKAQKLCKALAVSQSLDDERDDLG